MGMAMVGVAVAVVHAGDRVISRGLARWRWRLGPDAEVFRARCPGQEAFQVGARWRIALVASAFVEVGAQVGLRIQSGFLGGGGDGPDRGGVAGGAAVA